MKQHAVEFGGMVRFTHTSAGRGKEARRVLGPCHHETLKTHWSHTFLGVWLVWGGLTTGGGFQEFRRDLACS